MKKALIILSVFIVLSSCSNNPSSNSGAVEDNSKNADTSAVLPSAHKDSTVNPQTDSSKMEDRVDLQQRKDSSK
jgi:hypothetical protein